MSERIAALREWISARAAREELLFAGSFRVRLPWSGRPGGPET